MNITKFLHSFGFAVRGITAFVKKEQNIKVQLLAGLLVSIAAWYLKLSLSHRLVVVFLVFLIPGLEMLNGLFEELADLMKLPYSATTFLRNLSAGLVLWFSIMTVVIGIMIFGQYF